VFFTSCRIGDCSGNARYHFMRCLPKKTAPCAGGGVSGLHQELVGTRPDKRLLDVQYVHRFRQAVDGLEKARYYKRCGIAGKMTNNQPTRRYRLAQHASTPDRALVSPLSQAAISRRLACPAPPPDPEDLHIAPVPEGIPVTEAAVLVPLVPRDAQVHVLLTQRTAHLVDHAGQICFPGGRVEAADRSREDTALRETEEEIGLRRHHVRVLGRLPPYEIPSGFRIVPIVAWVAPPFELKPDAFEVAAAFEVPLEHFLDPARYQRREYHFRGRHRHYMAIPYEGRYIWGATAGMLYSLCRMINLPEAENCRNS